MVSLALPLPRSAAATRRTSPSRTGAGRFLRSSDDTVTSPRSPAARSIQTGRAPMRTPAAAGKVARAVAGAGHTGGGTFARTSLRIGEGAPRTSPPSASSFSTCGVSPVADTVAAAAAAAGGASSSVAVIAAPSAAADHLRYPPLSWIDRIDGPSASGRESSDAGLPRPPSIRFQPGVNGSAVGVPAPIRHPDR
ncbi:hypothetical protein F4553_001088 [Allocatelliglobosispora scoriae]|uniref:Uncharacterized protein n=1 Tax=Allocatelliglobosispora scoriae TaxID=643052 RepID=A0A841BKJ1_9ACTN|nr:hypothetical protein [Allocatelliglobosispora scoriae]